MRSRSQFPPAEMLESLGHLQPVLPLFRARSLRSGLQRWNAFASAVNLKFLSLLAASSFRNFKFKTALES
jgi:hypothetical protein